MSYLLLNPFSSVSFPKLDPEFPSCPQVIHLSSPFIEVVSLVVHICVSYKFSYCIHFLSLLNPILQDLLELYVSFV